MVSVLKTPWRELIRRRARAIGRAHGTDVHLLLGGEIVRMIDVGASGGAMPRWYPYRRDLSFVGFEPDERSSLALMNSEEAREFAEYEVMPIAAWDQDGTVTISFTAKPECSSYFQPNTGFLDRFPESERFKVTGSAEMECRSLDSVLSDRPSPADFIKLDLEGGELKVLQGAEHVLRTCLGLQIEVCFQTLREGQPLFGDISRFLEDKDIEFVDFIHIFRWERDGYRQVGQAIFADALFLRSPENVLGLVESGSLALDKLKTYLAILLIYERHDIAARIIDLAAHMDIDGGYLTRAAAVMDRRKKAFDSRVKTVARVQRVMGRLNPTDLDDFALHYLY